MTKNASFKKKIREHMAKTGQRYAAARHALLARGRPAGAAQAEGLLPGYVIRTGIHPDSARLAAALAHAGVVDPATGGPFSEAKLFGLSGGVGFMYFVFEYAGHPPMMTFNCSSWSMPGPRLDRALQFAGLRAFVSQTTSARVAAKALDGALDEGRVAHLTVDRASLPWSGADEVWVGHLPWQVNVVGRNGQTYLVDDGAPFEVSGETVQKARAAVRKQKHRLVTFGPGEASSAPAEAIRSAAAFTSRNYRESPVKGFAGNFGLTGLAKVARAMSDAKDRRGWPKLFASGQLVFTALVRVWECTHLEYTAPAGGRPLYADFLEESTRFVPALEPAAALARESGDLFGLLAEDVVSLGGPALSRAIELTHDIDEARHPSTAGGTADSVGEQVRALRAERDALGAELELDEKQRLDIFRHLGERVSAIEAVETKLADALHRAVQR